MSRIVFLLCEKIFLTIKSRSCPGKNLVEIYLMKQRFISNIQTPEEILSSSNATISSDGTSRDRPPSVSRDWHHTVHGFTLVASEDSSTLLGPYAQLDSKFEQDRRAQG
ncbi:hypothetical protein ElyMa_001627800 [Elysia marginata]|uniref:Uncharacterized protein n=1 Tax=Elysia marginata TaxID=1093978 RepID=A0AAV4JPR5_9GAST|nr:hypothetical protein ElyMa_001627800 [Elysia marginata]